MVKMAYFGSIFLFDNVVSAIFDYKSCYGKLIDTFHLNALCRWAKLQNSIAAKPHNLRLLCKEGKARMEMHCKRCEIPSESPYSRVRNIYSANTIYPIATPKFVFKPLCLSMVD